MSAPWPVKLTFRACAQELAADWDDGKSGRASYRTLRLESPSAEVQGHGRGPKPPPPIVPDDIRVLKAEPVGRYALRLFFSDGHSSGLYTWGILRTLTVGD
ncbi:gamma-butyrobetaine hydroxylase-like domain-containing protein [Hyphomonas sp.]|uniref:gamma-butyrobetaine hydroxylase-like domain-containing protein n=1 Tax=Hyphomonas sp. TaxID=87 RepID=UPI003919DA1B